MKKLATKYQALWVGLGLVPMALFVYLIGEVFNVKSSTTVLIQLPLITAQIFGLFMYIASLRYEDK